MPTYTPDLEALAAACIDAPDDMAPRRVLSDYLEERPEYAVQYANWNWYWNDLIPAFTRMLGEKEGVFSPMPRLGAYGPRVAYSGLKPHARLVWSFAFLRTLVRQDGETLFSSEDLSPESAAWIAQYELKLFDIPNGTEYIPLAFCGYGSADTIVWATPINLHGAFEQFIGMYNDWLREFGTKCFHLGGPIPAPKYSNLFLFPTWVQGTLVYTAKSHRKHLKLLQDLQSY